MGVNKVIFGDETLIDLTGDTVTPDTLVKGATAHDASGKKITGTFEEEDISAETAEYTTELSSQDLLLQRIRETLDVKFARPSTLQNKTVTPSESSQIVTADSGFDGLGVVTVDGIPQSYTDEVYQSGYDAGLEDATPTLQSKTVTPSTSAQTVLPDSGFDGLSKVLVNAIPQSILDAEYQKGYDEAFELFRPYKQEVSYIQTSGTQYINTNLKPNGRYRVVMDFQLTSVNSWTCIFGSADTSTNTNSFALWHDGKTFLYYYGTNQSKAFPSSVTATGEHSADCNAGTATIDGNSVSFSTLSFSGAQPLYLGCVNYGGTAMYFAKGKWKPCKIYNENGDLVRDYIPVLDWDDVPCMYDKVTHKLYYNAGTGSFTYA